MCYHRQLKDTFVVTFCPDLGADTLVTSVGKRELYQNDFLPTDVPSVSAPKLGVKEAKCDRKRVL